MGTKVCQLLVSMAVGDTGADRLRWMTRLTMNGEQGFSNSPSTTVKSLDSLGDLEGDPDEPDMDKTSFTARTKKVASHLKVSNALLTQGHDLMRRTASVVQHL